MVHSIRASLSVWFEKVKISHNIPFGGKAEQHLAREAREGPKTYTVNIIFVNSSMSSGRAYIQKSL